MSAFNTVLAKLKCPACGAAVTLPVQFKYGDTWQLNYEVGDLLKSGGNDVGEPGKGHVVVSGIVDADGCPACGQDAEWYVYIHIEEGRIVRIENADGRFDFVAAGRDYVVCD